MLRFTSLTIAVAIAGCAGEAHESNPRAMSGTFQISSYEYSDGGTLYGKGRFYGDPIALDRYWQDSLLTNFADIPLDGCVLRTYPGGDGDPSPIPPHMDAGAVVRVDGPNGDFLLEPTTILLEPWYASLMPEDPALFAPGATYRLIAPGGPDVRAFDVEIHAPPSLTVLEPQHASQTLTIRRDVALPVRWTPGAGEPVVLRLSRYDADATELACRFADDGEHEVPVDVLAGLAASGPEGELPSASLDIGRYTWESFDAGLAKPVIVRFETGWFSWARVE